MRLASVSCGFGGLAAALCVALLTDVASAQAGEASGVPSTQDPEPPKARVGPLRLKVTTNGVPFDRDKLRATLSQELGQPVVLSKGDGADIDVRLESATRAQVRYVNPAGVVFTRGVDLPPDRERAVQVVSWVGVNMVQNEAEELLKALRERRKAEAEAEARAAEQAAADKAAAERAAAEQAAADKAAADLLAADKAAADKAAAKAAADKAAADKAAAEKASVPPPPPPPALPPLLRDPLRSLDVAFVTPISLLRDSPKRQLHLQLALAYGESGGIDGLAMSAAALRVRRDSQGVVVAPGAAIVGGNVRGVVTSVGYAQVGGNLEGALVGAGAAVQRGAKANGVIVSVGGAMAGETTGVVVGAGFATAKSLQGVGVSAGATIVRGPSEGVLVGGGATWSAQHSGLSISSGVNVARELEGFAVAPINVHGRVSGLQFGIVNVAEEVDGAAIGVVSLSKNGRLQPMFWGGYNGSAHLALKSVAGWAFTQLGGGVDLDASRFTYDGGIGLHLRLGQMFFLEPGVHYSAAQKIENTTGAPDTHRLHYVALVGVRLGNKLDLLAGGGVSQRLVGDSGAAVEPDVRVGIAFF
ncbi:MAG TPA: hypothetical protein VHP33_09605 [Polyangiaceae bacterium]|nr:hypothetical protein [Polyangiaceae bacterium]